MLQNNCTLKESHSLTNEHTHRPLHSLSLCDSMNNYTQEGGKVGSEFVQLNLHLHAHSNIKKPHINILMTGEAILADKKR